MASNVFSCFLRIVNGFCVVLIVFVLRCVIQTSGWKMVLVANSSRTPGQKILKNLGCKFLLNLRFPLQASQFFGVREGCVNNFDFITHVYLLKVTSRSKERLHILWHPSREAGKLLVRPSHRRILLAAARAVCYQVLRSYSSR